MKNNRNSALSYILISAIIILIAFFVYIAFFELPNSKVAERQVITVVKDTVDYNDYVFQQKLVELYSDIADKQQNQYTWLLVFFIGVVVVIIFVFISTFNKLFNYQIENKIKEVERHYEKKLMERIEKDEN